MAALLAAVSLAAAACGDDGDEGGGEGLVGVGLTDAGTGDFSFNDAAAVGAQAINDDLGLDTQIATPKKAQEQANLELLVGAGANPVIAIGFSYETALNTVGPANPDTQFAIVDSSAVNQPNVTGLVFAEEQGSFLMGALGAQVSQTGQLGFIGAQQIPLLEKFAAGYKAGAEQAGADLGKTVSVAIQWIGTGNETFSAPDKAQVIANSMADQGVDVLYAAAGGSGGGMFQVCGARALTCLGVDSDQYTQYSAQPDIQKQILTSMVKRVDTAMVEFTKSWQDDPASVGGRTITYDLSTGGVGYATSNSALTDEMKSFMDGYSERITAGEITVPSTLS